MSKNITITVCQIFKKFQTLTSLFFFFNALNQVQDGDGPWWNSFSTRKEMVLV
jgi:hypothetical protein